MKILITGVAGMFGSNVAGYLASKGHQVAGLDNLSGGYRDFVPDGIRFHECDLYDTVAVDRVFQVEKPEAVFHFAAYAAEGLSPFIRGFNYKNNVVCSAHVVNACVQHDVRKLLFTSSMAAYGAGHPPFREEDVLEPDDPYGIAKMTVEKDIQHAGRFFGLRYTIFRPHNVVGINQNIWDRYRNVIGIWIRQALSNEPLTIYGDGDQVRAWSDVEGCFSPFEKCLTGFDGEIFNVGSDVCRTVNEGADLVVAEAGRHGLKAQKRHVEGRKEVYAAFASHEKAKKALGFKDDTDMRKVVSKMFSWAMTQPSRPVKTMAYEVDKNLYSFWK